MWPLVKENVASMRCFFSTGYIEISSLPTDRGYSEFRASEARIHMTATLADDLY